MDSLLIFWTFGAPPSHTLALPWIRFHSLDSCLHSFVNDLFISLYLDPWWVYPISDCLTPWICCLADEGFIYSWLLRWVESITSSSDLHGRLVPVSSSTIVWYGSGRSPAFYKRILLKSDIHGWRGVSDVELLIFGSLVGGCTAYTLQRSNRSYDSR